MIRPLDLQTLYMNLEKVGKETAVSKEAAALAQSLQVEKLQREHDQGQHSVGRTNPTADPEADAKVDSDGRNPSGQKQAPNKKGEQNEEEQKDTWKDPELGKHVDLSG